MTVSTSSAPTTSGSAYGKSQWESVAQPPVCQSRGVGRWRLIDLSPAPADAPLEPRTWSLHMRIGRATTEAWIVRSRTLFRRDRLRHRSRHRGTAPSSATPAYRVSTAAATRSEAATRRTRRGLSRWFARRKSAPTDRVKNSGSDNTQAPTSVTSGLVARNPNAIAVVAKPARAPRPSPNQTITSRTTLIAMLRWRAGESESFPTVPTAASAAEYRGGK